MLDANFVTALVLGALLGAACVSLLAGSMARRRVADLTAAHQLSIALLQAQYDKRLAETQAGVEDRVASALRESEHRHEVAMLAERERISLQHQDNLKVTEDRLQGQLAKVESPLTVVVHPFVNTTIDKGLIRNSSVVEVLGLQIPVANAGIRVFRRTTWWWRPSLRSRWTRTPSRPGRPGAGVCRRCGAAQGRWNRQHADLGGQDRRAKPQMTCGCIANDSTGLPIDPSALRESEE